MSLGQIENESRIRFSKIRPKTSHECAKCVFKSIGNIKSGGLSNQILASICHTNEDVAYPHFLRVLNNIPSNYLHFREIEP